MSASLFPGATPHPSGFQQVSPLDVKDRLGELRLIDVREPDEFVGALGRVSGAELVPLGGVDGAARSWSREAPLLVICRSGGRSGRAATALAGMGFTRVYNLTGGMLLWNELGYPVVTGPVG